MSKIRYANNSDIAKLNISYYDEIADTYDEILSQDDSNEAVREQVKQKFKALLRPEQRVLDFGGGTGLDLPWLMANKYHVIFCEPSTSMRQKAIANCQSRSNNVTFLGDSHTDFTTWQQQPPFAGQVDGILCNFGVINCIPDINLLFHNLAMVSKPRSHLLAVLLDRPFKKMWNWHRRNTIKTLFTRSPFVMYVYHNTHKQTVFVHSLKEVKRAASSWFNYSGHQLLADSDFILVHLTRK
jgi:SAM-dependent methyltransferase